MIPDQWIVVFCTTIRYAVSMSRTTGKIRSSRNEPGGSATTRCLLSVSRREGDEPWSFFVRARREFHRPRGAPNRDSAEPDDQVVDEFVPVGLEFERMAGVRIFDQRQIWRGELADVARGGHTVDDLVLPGQHDQDRQPDRRGTIR